nr:Gag-Pol polyprotein [Tanacetum cinerariifolium]
EAKGDEGYFIGYSMSSKAFKVLNKRTRRVEENLHVEFLENKAIEKARQEEKKDVSSLRYIALPNWVHDALLESSSSKPQDDCSTDVPKSSGNFNPTATSTNPPPDQLETLTVETPIPTVSLPVLTACFTDSPEPSSDTRLISKRVANQVEKPSLDNILTLTNRFEDILGVTTNSADSDGVEADIRMRLYIRGKEHGKQLLDSVNKGPFKFGTVPVSGTITTPASTGDKNIDDITPEEKIRKAYYGLGVPKFLPTNDLIECLNKTNDIDVFNSNFDEMPTPRQSSWHISVLMIQMFSLREYFETFVQGLLKEINEMKVVFNQIETEVDQCSVDRKYFEIEKNVLLIEIDRLLEQLIFQDIMCTAMHADLENKCGLPANDDILKYVDMEKSYIDEYSRCLELEAELSKKKDIARALKPLDNALDYACYLTNDSGDIRKLKPKADIGIFIRYSTAKKAHQIYNKRKRMIMETIHVELDKLTVMTSEQLGSRPAPQLLTPGYISSGLPSPSVVSHVLFVTASLPADTTGTPSSTIIDQDAPSTSISPTTKETQAPVIHQGVEKYIQGNQNAQFDNDPFINIFTPYPSFEESSSRDVIQSNVHPINKPYDHLRKWSKDYSLDNVIGNPSRPVSTRCQL